MTNDELLSLLEEAERQERGVFGYFSSGNAEEAEEMGLIEIDGRGRISLTPTGREWLKNRRLR
jgi:hypothetical protein